MIKEECKKASIILHRIFAGDIMTVTKIVTAEANNDYETLRSMLLRVQDEIVSLNIALKKLEDRARLEMENTEFDCGHNVKHRTEDDYE